MTKVRLSGLVVGNGAIAFVAAPLFFLACYISAYLPNVS